MTVKIAGREIDGIIFDVEGTFYDQATQQQIFAGAQLEIGRSLLGRQGILTPPDSQIKQMRDLYLETVVRVGWIPAFCVLGGMEEEYHRILRNIDRAANLEFNPVLQQFLKQLQSNASLAILSAAREYDGLAVCQKVLGEEWRCLFEVVAFEDSVGMPAVKPDPRAHEYVVTRLGVDPDRCAFVGDTVRDDIVPAVALGLMGIYVGDQTDGPWHLRVSRLEDLATYLQFP